MIGWGLLSREAVARAEEALAQGEGTGSGGVAKMMVFAAHVAFAMFTSYRLVK